MRDRLDDVIDAAVADGVLPTSAVRPESEQRPWPVVLLTALGAWLAAGPLLAVVALLLGPLVDSGAGPYLIGLLAAAGAAVLLRSRSVPLFVEQLAVPGLLVGLGTLGFGLYRDLPDTGASLVLAGVTLTLALLLRQAWLRVLWGAATAVLVGAALLTPERFFLWGERDALWWVLHLLLVIVWAMPWLQGRWRGQGAAVESVATGWWLVVLTGLTLWSGMTFMVGGVLGNFSGEGSAEGGVHTVGPWARSFISALLALVGAALAARRWPGLRHPALMVVAGVLAGLSWWMPTLGAVVLALGSLASTQRWRLAAAAAVAFTWIVGAFYYALMWPLATKAWVLVGAGALIAAVAWVLTSRRNAVTDKTPSDTTPSPALDRRALWVAVSTVAVLVVAAGAIWEKQALLSRGQAVYVALAPVDPRSLMQGDYMRLNFRVPRELMHSPVWGASRPKLVALRDARGVATMLRVATPAEVLAPGEFLFELTPKAGEWMLVTDAWFFREGEGERWAGARYGEFRVTPDGRALLVGMADEQLQAIVP